MQKSDNAGGLLYEFWILSPGLITSVVMSRLSVRGTAGLAACESGRGFFVWSHAKQVFRSISRSNMYS